MPTPAHAQNLLHRPQGQGDPGLSAPESPTNSRHAGGRPGAAPAAPAVAAASTPFSPFMQARDSSQLQGSPSGGQHSQGSLNTPGPVRASNNSSENGSGSGNSARGAHGACELLLVCGGVDNLSLVGVLCSCHRWVH
eukprot:scaffold126539_cov14-Tisochrysis_lutea.AAC.1